MENSERMAKLLEEELRKVRQGTSDGLAILHLKSYSLDPATNKAKVSVGVQTYNPRQSDLITQTGNVLKQMLALVLGDRETPINKRFDKDGNEISAEIEPAAVHRNRAAKGWTN